MTPAVGFRGGSSQTRNVSPVEPREGGRHRAPPVKTPKYAGKSDWEAFHAQFELLATGGRVVVGRRRLYSWHYASRMMLCPAFCFSPRRTGMTMKPW